MDSYGRTNDAQRPRQPARCVAARQAEAKNRRVRLAAGLGVNLPGKSKSRIWTGPCLEGPSADLSFDYSAGAKQYRLRDLETKGPGSLEVDYQLVLVWSVDRQVCRARTVEDAIDVLGTTCNRPR